MIVVVAVCQSAPAAAVAVEAPPTCDDGTGTNSAGERTKERTHSISLALFRVMMKEREFFFCEKEVFFFADWPIERVSD